MFPLAEPLEETLCLGGGVDCGCELGVVDVSLDGYLSVDSAGVAGGVGADGCDCGNRLSATGGGAFVGWRRGRHP